MIARDVLILKFSRRLTDSLILCINDNHYLVFFNALNAPIQKVLNDFRDYAYLMKKDHINARSVTKHRHEIERLLYEGFFDMYTITRHV